MSVPIVSAWCASSFSPVNSTAPVAITPRSSIDGKKIENSFCV